MRIKRMMIAIAGIMIVLGLNAIATAIDNPEVYAKPLPNPVPVAQLEMNNHIDKMAKRYRLNPDVVKALIEEESGWLSSAEEVDVRIFDKQELKAIAEHLLIYVRNEDEE